MSGTQQPEALRLARWLEHRSMSGVKPNDLAASTELRSQHARIEELEAQLSAIGAGGVEPLRKRAAPAALAVPMAEAWEQSAADTEHQRTGAGLHFNQGVADGLRICAKDLRAALAAPAHPSEGVPEQTSRDAVIQHLTSAGVLEHDGCGIFIASGDASELIDACMAISATHPTKQGLDVARYRWLRARDLETICQGGVFAGMTPQNVILSGEDLDAAVDAAMAAQAKQGGAND